MLFYASPRQRHFSTRHIKMLVLDEADEMLNRRGQRHKCHNKDVDSFCSGDDIYRLIVYSLQYYMQYVSHDLTCSSLLVMMMCFIQIM